MNANTTESRACSPVAFTGAPDNSQRADLIRHLVAGVAGTLANAPHMAADIGKGIVTLVDAVLNPVQSAPTVRIDGSLRINCAPRENLPGISPAAQDHASAVLYPAIKAAMDELLKLPAQSNTSVNRAFNHLHEAFWSETPAPTSAAPLRSTVPSPDYDSTAHRRPNPAHGAPKPAGHNPVA